MSATKKFFGHGDSLSAVAQATGLSLTTVSRHASGRRKIAAHAALLYEAKLGVPRSQLRPDLWPPDEDAEPYDRQDQAKV